MGEAGDLIWVLPKTFRTACISKAGLYNTLIRKLIQILTHMQRLGQKMVNKEALLETELLSKGFF